MSQALTAYSLHPESKRVDRPYRNGGEIAGSGLEVADRFGMNRQETAQRD